MAQFASPALSPRKSPVQARSTATVDDILQATIQVLLKDGKDRLTTTRVAQRAGVSVGTLYQYFPNKSALLQAALRRHLEEVAGAVHRVCREHPCKPIAEMTAALIEAFLAAKMRDSRTSVALYAVSSDLDGARIARQISNRLHQSIVTLIETAPEPLARPAPLMVDMLQGALAGVSRKLLETPSPERHLPALREELLFLAGTYVSACTKPQPH